MFLRSPEGDAEALVMDLSAPKISEALCPRLILPSS